MFTFPVRVFVMRARTIADLQAALREAKQVDRTAVIYIEVNRYAGAPAYESWWDVPVAEVSPVAAVQAARAEYEEQRGRYRDYL